MALIWYDVCDAVVMVAYKRCVTNINAMNLIVNISFLSNAMLEMLFMNGKIAMQNAMHHIISVLMFIVVFLLLQFVVWYNVGRYWMRCS
jgi:hypothetical protein